MYIGTYGWAMSHHWVMKILVKSNRASGPSIGYLADIHNYRSDRLIAALPSKTRSKQPK